MLSAIVFLFAQSTPSDGITAGLKVQVSQISEMFDCMDKELKTQLTLHFTDATPEIVVDGAFKSCNSISEKIRIVTASTLSNTMSQDKATVEAGRIYAEQDKRMRDEYVKHVDQFLAGATFAESRYKVVIADWSKCVRDKAISWSRLTEDAKTIAQAAVSSCSDKKANVELALPYVVRSQNLPPSARLDLMKSVETAIFDHGVQWVVEERAKALPR